METSPAKRILAIIESAMRHHNVDMTVLDGFAQIFEIKSKDDHEVQDAVTILLTAVRAEVREVDSALKARGAPEALRQLIIREAMNFTTSTQRQAQWRSHVANHLRADVMTGWGWVAHFLPADVIEFTDEDYRDLVHQLEQLEQAAAKEGVPPELRRLVSRQAERIRNALRMYTVQGAAAMRSAVNENAMDFVRYGDSLRDVDTKKSESRAVFSYLGRVWRGTAKAAGEMKTVVDFWLLISKHHPHIGPLIEEAKKYLPS